MRPAEVSVRCTNDLKELERLNQVVEDFGMAHRLPESVVFELNLALDEVFTNVVSYAYDDSQPHTIEIRLWLDELELRAEVEDDGKPFNPLEAAAPDVNQPVEERSIGGLGIHLVRKVMDTLAYERRSGRNLLVLGKRLSSL